MENRIFNNSMSKMTVSPPVRVKLNQFRLYASELYPQEAEYENAGRNYNLKKADVHEENENQAEVKMSDFPLPKYYFRIVKFSLSNDVTQGT